MKVVDRRHVAMQHLGMLVEMLMPEGTVLVFMLPMNTHHRLVVIACLGSLLFVPVLHVAMFGAVPAVHVAALAFMRLEHGLVLGLVTASAGRSCLACLALFGLAADTGRRLRLIARFGFFVFVVTTAFVVEFAARHAGSYETHRTSRTDPVVSVPPVLLIVFAPVTVNWLVRSATVVTAVPDPMN